MVIQIPYKAIKITNGALIRVLFRSHVSPVELKGSVALELKNDMRSQTTRASRMWDEQYAQHPLWWKGPYDISPIVQRVKRGAAVLDIGCGTGRYLTPLDRSGFVAVGVDLSNVALQLLDSHHARVVADVQDLPFADHSFDAVTCYGVFQHLTQIGRTRAVAELFRVLKHDGLVFVEVIGKRDLRYRSCQSVEADTFVRDGIRYHYFSLSEFLLLFESAGFDVITLDDRITTRRYHGVKRVRHRILMIAKRS